jgi:amino acid adenylation domain-containing protein
MSTNTTKNIEAIYPLTPTQEGMLFHAVESPGSGVYVHQTVMRLRGSFDLERFKQAWELIIARHDGLRTLFTWEKRDQPLQLLRQRVTADWRSEDWRGRDTAQVDAALEEFLRSDLHAPFDLSKAPLYRFAVFQAGADDTRFVWTYHHLITDGWSTHVLLEELFAAYDSLGRGQLFERERPRPFREYVEWIGSQDLAAAERFWREELRDVAPVELAGPPHGASDHTQIDYALPADLSAELRAFAQANRVTLNTVMQAAWSAVLSARTGSQDVLFGVTTSGRPFALHGVDRMTGMFITTLPLRVRLGDAPVRDWLQAIQEGNLRVRAVEYTPVARLRAWSGGDGSQQLFDNIFVFENFPADNSLLSPGSTLSLAEYRQVEHSHFPFALVIFPGDALRLYMVYDASRFDDAAIAGLRRQYESALRALLTAQYARDVSVLEAAEHAQLAALGAGVSPVLEQPDALIHDLIADHARTTPDAPALIYKDTVLSHAELDQRATQLAHWLRANDVGPDAPVALCVERSVDMIVGIVGILKAGGAYVPVDPDYPAERIGYVLDDCAAPVLLTQAALLDRLPPGNARVLCLDRDWPQVAAQPAPALAVPVTPDHLAYMIYTSGSTGQPKGVMISHRNLAHSTAARFQFYGEPARRYLLLSSFAFDSSVAGIFWALCQGGALVLPEQKQELDAPAIGALIRRHAVTHTLCLPSLYAILLEQDAAALRSLRVVIVAGEACTPGVIAQHRAALPQTGLYNEYGPTEATVWCTACRIDGLADAGSGVPIGGPVPYASVSVRDTLGRLLPHGVTGELYVGGLGLARGYHNQPALTGERFVTIDGQRLYRTGDLARWRPDGMLAFLGRVDGQIKLRGHRIELGEIEHVLAQHPAVAQAVAVITQPAASVDIDTLIDQLARLSPAEAAAHISAVKEQPHA